MPLNCLKKDCRGKISNGNRGRQFYWEGDEYTCPKCKTEYIIGCTDDYPDDTVAYLIEKNQNSIATESE